MSDQKLDAWLQGYLEYMAEVSRRSEGTVIDVKCTLRRVSWAMEKVRPGTPLWKVKFEDYLIWMNEERERGTKDATLAKMLSHLRGLLDYAWRAGRSDRNVLDGFSLKDRLKAKEPESLTVEEAEKIVRATGKRTKAERRDRLIILLLYGCGLRTQELASLDVSDVDIERQEISVWHGKGDRERKVPVPGGVWTELLAYLAERGGKRGALFRTEAKKIRMPTTQVCDVVKRAAQRAGIEKMVTPKTLRHSFATHLMDQGVCIGVIASLMGHRSPNETGVYLHVLPGRKEAAIKRLDREKKA